MSKTRTTEDIITDEVMEILELESGLIELEQEISQNEQFRNFLDYQRETKKTIDEFWDKVEEHMVKHDVKSIKGDWGTLTIAERLNWKTDETLPNKFYKKLVDTKKLSDTYRLEGKAPKGATPSYTKYLTKRLKNNTDRED